MYTHTHITYMYIIERDMHVYIYKYIYIYTALFSSRADANSRRAWEPGEHAIPHA